MLWNYCNIINKKPKNKHVLPDTFSFFSVVQIMLLKKKWKLNNTSKLSKLNQFNTIKNWTWKVRAPVILYLFLVQLINYFRNNLFYFFSA